ncbi:hypothetical protein F8O01_00535 [Pseudoclavibacter chungangensis]|uniref:SDR-like Ig domain-containing protein n=1 Tax=Pseudoclavibacter chungangensis TaxID=587635 RepID=A0A7J5C1H4_9MICO|nr:Ig-like domain-containing protein [Pseudoclavibacter chungangensis]KAB1662471.1 hypothetical protein F8O01_00535 [Pseudoclavibacter chungangensis]NYJ68504.1 hypothetical protein [Pseudoclavibacter chungangensis]
MIRQIRATLALVVGVLIALTGLFGVSTAASAAEIPNSGDSGISNVKTDKQQYAHWEYVEVTFDWTVPNGSKAGDTMTLELPEGLDWASIADFTMTVSESDSTPVADVSIDRAAGVLTITLLPYVEAHRDVTGSANFRSTFNTEKVDVNTPTQTVDLFGTQVTVTGDVPTPGPDWLGKNGWWYDSEYESTGQNADGSLINANGPHITWVAQLSNTGWTQAVVKDTLDTSLQVCRDGKVIPGLEPHLEGRDIATGRWGQPVPDSASLTTTCNDDGTFTFTVTKPASLVDPQIRVVYYSNLVTDEAGRPVVDGTTTVGIKPAYDNAIEVILDGTETETYTKVVQAFGAGGYGSGVPGPAIDIEKYSGEWEGVQFVDGVPQITAGPEYEPVNQPEGDYDTGALTVEPGAETTVAATVTNIGIETLGSIVVSDLTTDGPALTNVQCTVDGRTFDADASGVVKITDVLLAPGASFLCTGTLTLAASETHADTAHVTAAGAVTGIPVEDEDVWAAEASAEATTPPTTPSTTVPPTTVPTTPTSSTPVPPSLAQTGGTFDAVPFLAAAAALIAGAAIVLVRARAARK